MLFYKKAHADIVFAQLNYLTKEKNLIFIIKLKSSMENKVCCKSYKL